MSFSISNVVAGSQLSSESVTIIMIQFAIVWVSVRYHILKALKQSKLADRIARGLPTDSEESDDD